MSMQLVDLVVEGVRRFRKSQKITFKPGFNLIYGSNESGKSTLLEVILELLFPDRFREKEISFLSWHGVENSRAGLTLARKQDTYRVLREFSSNHIALSRFNPDEQKYETMAEEATEVGSILADVFDLPPFETFRNMFINQPERLPSSLPLELKVQKPEPHADAAPAQAPGPPGSMPGVQPQTGFGYQEMSYPGPSTYGAPGMMPPGMMPPGMMPPGMMPPGMMPPGMIPPGMSMPGMMAQEVLSEKEIEEKEKRLKELKDEYARTKDLEELQFEIDGLQARIFEIEGKKKNINKVDEAIKQAEEILDSYSFFENLPENIDERLGRYNNLLEMQAKEIEKIDEKALVFDEELMMHKQKPIFYKESLFKVGVALLVVGVGSLLLRSFNQTFQVLALLILGGLGIIGYMAWQHLDLQSKIEKIEKTIKDYENQRQVVFKKFEVEGALTRRLLEQTDTESTDELKEKIEKYRKVQEKAKNLQRRRREMMIEIDWDSLQKEESDLKARIEELEEKVRSHVAVSMDPNEMKREIKELEELLDKHKPGPGAEDAAVPDLSSHSSALPEPAPAAQAPDPGRTRMDHDVSATLLSGPSAPAAYERMLSGAVSLLGIDREKLIQHFSSRLQLYLQALTSKRYQKAEWNKEGVIHLITTEGGGEASLAQLSPAARDAVYFALQFTLLELLVQKYPLPLLLDDPYLHLDEGRQMVVSQALKRLSDRTQVILFSTQRIHSKHASHSLNLG